MNIVITGASGFIGSFLMRELLRRNRTVTALSRSAHPSLPDGVTAVQWDARTPGSWTDALEGADAVYHLAGKNILSGRWTAQTKKALVESRVDSTRLLVDGMQRAQRKPKIFISASAVGYYGDTGVREVDESAANGSDFLAQLCRAWEEAARPAIDLGIRVVNPRIGIVLHPSGGPLQRLSRLFTMYAGGHPGSGAQFFPWIHAADLTQALLFPLDHPEFSGAYNAVAPNPVSIKEFCRALGRELNRPSWMHPPAFALRTVLGEAAEMLLNGHRAVPRALLENGFTFAHPDLDDALKDLLR